MTPPDSTKLPPSKLALLATCVWVVVFLAFFFAQALPNNTLDPEDPLTRLDIWGVIAQDWLFILNPLDYSTDANAGWHNLTQRLPFVGVAFVLLLSAWSCGRFVTDRLSGMSELLASERLVVDFGIGISIQTVWILCCGVAGVLRPIAIAAPLALMLVIAFQQLQNNTEGPSDRKVVADTSRSRGIRRWWPLLLVAPFALHLVLGGFTPPFDFDVREYHLQGPKEWFQAGRIHNLEHNVYTSFPFLSEMLSLGAMVLHGDWWKGAIAGKLTLTVFQLLSAICVYAIGRRWMGRRIGLIAALILLSTPWTLRISIIAYAEGALSFYIIASLMMALLACHTSNPGTRRQFHALAGFLAGSAMAAKYPGVLSAVIPVGLLLVVQGIRRGRTADAGDQAGRTVTGDVLVYAFAVVLAVSPWLVKNAVWNGNPVYPLAYSVFGASDWSVEMDTKWKRAHSASEHSLNNIPNHLLDVALRNDWQNGLLFALAVPSLLLLRRQRAIKWLGLHVVWVLVTWWIFTHRIDRFWVPVIPGLAIVAAAAWMPDKSRPYHVFLNAVLIVCCLFNYGFCRLPSVIGRQAGLTDMETLRKAPVRQDLSVLNKTLPENARVLMVGEAEVFDADFDLLYNTVFDESLFELWTRADDQADVSRREQKMKTAAELRAAFAERGVSHIYVNWSEILRYRLTYGYTDYVFPGRFEELQQHGIVRAPITMSAAEWNRLNEQQKYEIKSWPGHDALLSPNGIWQNRQLYEVVP